MSDLISRQTAIDAIYDAFCYAYCDNCEKEMTEDLCGDCHRKYQNWSASKKIIGKVINNLPPAEPEQRWIPVSDRLPEIDMTFPHWERYLVQYEDGDMDVASWSNVNRFWTDHVTEPHWNCVQFQTVTAWMPLPEPWKGEEE